MSPYTSHVSAHPRTDMDAADSLAQWRKLGLGVIAGAPDPLNPDTKPEVDPAAPISSNAAGRGAVAWFLDATGRAKRRRARMA